MITLRAGGGAPAAGEAGEGGRPPPTTIATQPRPRRSLLLARAPRHRQPPPSFPAGGAAGASRADRRAVEQFSIECVRAHERRRRADSRLATPPRLPARRPPLPPAFSLARLARGVPRVRRGRCGAVALPPHLPHHPTPTATGPAHANSPRRLTGNKSGARARAREQPVQTGRRETATKTKGDRSVTTGDSRSIPGDLARSRGRETIRSGLFDSF